MNKIITMLLAGIMLFSCSSKQDEEISSSLSSIEVNDVSETESKEPVKMSSVESKPVIVKKEITLPKIDIEQKKLPESEALEFTSKLKVGWNLGNTFDAVWSENNKNELDLESYWCGVKTTEDMILAVKEAGFSTIRIPVSWHNHVDEDFNISKQWLDRVQVVVDWAMDAGLYVILNIHHDNEKEFMYPDSEHYENSKDFVTSVWKQVSERFSSYSDEKLIYETLNEPRLKGHKNEWWIDNKNPDCIDAIKTINKLNQDAVDVIRASGGENKTRYIMTPGYCASPDGATNANFVIAKDIQENNNKILISVHSYSPYNFALKAPDENGSTATFDIDNSKDTGEVDNNLQKVYNKYVQHGIGVVLGEFGSRAKGDNEQERVDHAAYFSAKAASVGIPCVWWDNNAFQGNGELFGILNRREAEFAFPKIAQALVENW